MTVARRCFLFSSSSSGITSQSQVTELNLANRHVLWAPVTSAGVKLPLPLDSCCSLSLVSKTHAELVSQQCPNLCYKKLATPLPVSIASPDSQFQAVGIMQIPITWENGICSTFSMLVVPGLSSPILLARTTSVKIPQFPLPSNNHPQCRPSQLLPDPDPEPTVSGILTSQDSLISQPLASMIDYEKVYYTTVLVRSMKNKTVSPFNANLGVARSRTSADNLIWQDAADSTAEVLSDNWLNFVTSQPSWFTCHTSPVQPNYAGCASHSWNLAQQK